MNEKDFPILKNLKNNRLHYLDNAATTQKPKIVIDALRYFYEHDNANAHRGVYKLAEQATAMLNDARMAFSRFINAEADEIIFTKNATEGFNQLAASIEKTFIINPKHNIATTEIEHHSNFVPWQQLCKRTGAEFRIAKYEIKDDSIQDISRLVDENTVVAAFTAMSNVSGLKPDIKNIIKKIRKINPDTIIIIDATQLIAHERVDVKRLDADFICFSAHKIYGTTGVGIVYGKKLLLEKLEPFFYGGNMISTVSIDESTWADVPEKFEAGTIDVAGIYASSMAIKYLEIIGYEKLMEQEQGLKKYLLAELGKIRYVKIIGHNSKNNKNNNNNKSKNNNNYGPVVSFVVDKVHPHDLATIADRHDVCIRAGHHCCQPFMDALKVNATARASISFYNNKKDIDKLISAIKDAHKIIG